MNDQQMVYADALLAALAAIEERLAQIASYIAPAEQRDAPNIERPLEAFHSFDWDSIDAMVVKSDDFGPALVEWRGKMFKRRSPENKFGAAIWFSRANGKNEDGTNHYDILIKFRPVSDAEPISRAAETELRKAPPAPNGKLTSGDDFHRQQLAAQKDTRKQAGLQPETPPERFRRLVRETGTNEAEAGELLRFRQGDYGKAADDLQAQKDADEFDRMKSATEDPAIQETLAKADQRQAPPAPAHQTAGDPEAMLAELDRLALTAKNPAAAQTIAASVRRQVAAPNFATVLANAMSTLQKMQA